MTSHHKHAKPTGSSNTPPSHFGGIELQDLNIWSLLQDTPHHYMHSFACDCALRALQQERGQDRPPSQLAWDLIERKRMWINGSLDLHTYDSERLIVRELLRQTRNLALKERHPFGFAVWAHLGSLETLAAALDISHLCGMKTSASALKSAAARANTQYSDNSIIAVEFELRWQKLYLLSKEKNLQQTRKDLLAILLKRPIRGVLKTWKEEFEAPLFDQA
ncbi:MAG: hypothetical protein H6727_20135 [Myxococcales bacterium]|nr:hypothetical protein [Myxococcales bacterium]